MNSSGLGSNDTVNVGLGQPDAHTLSPFVVGRMLFLDIIASSSMLSASQEFLETFQNSNQYTNWASSRIFTGMATGSSLLPGVLVGTNYIKFISDSSRRVFDLSALLTQFQAPIFLANSSWGNSTPIINFAKGVIGLANNERNDYLQAYLRAK